MALSRLGPAVKADKNAAGLIDQELAAGGKTGYSFIYTPGIAVGGSVPTYRVQADPVAPGTTGQDHFFMDQTGVIRVNASAPASELDAPVRTPPPPVGPKRIRVSTGVMEPRLINKAIPVYPAKALQKRVQGTVRLRAIVSTEGAVSQIEVISGPPLLIPAAVDAVRQWRYKPTLLNEVPVEVETYIDVQFSLGKNPHRQ
jgi:TonB family protein